MRATPPTGAAQISPLPTGKPLRIFGRACLTTRFHQRQRAGIHPSAVALTTAELPDNAVRLQPHDCTSDHRRRQAEAFRQRGHRTDRMFLECVEHPQYGRVGAGSLEPLPVRLVTAQQSAGKCGALVGGLCNAFQKEAHPRLPVALKARSIQQFVVEPSMADKEKQRHRHIRKKGREAIQAPRPPNSPVTTNASVPHPFPAEGPVAMAREQTPGPLPRRVSSSPIAPASHVPSL